MATLVKTPSGTWKALIRKTGWPTVAKTFRTKHDAEDWSRRTEDEMVRGVYIQLSGSERMTLEAALHAQPLLDQVRIPANAVDGYWLRKAITQNTCVTTATVTEYSL
ncbi:Site-specific recombinase, phage integrase family protein [Pseudomonas amygdali pv. mellea]|nr:Site-specific recombinase, phage integrase family protein [Pseudomonas amygdali]KPX82898.1 Site-specific recombinase, phage integrase family protein [Pseudomonas amygdali pv. mellea]